MNNSTDPEYAVDSRYSSEEVQKADSVALMKARLERMENLPKEELMKAKLMQLKLKMTDYVENPVYDQRNYFLEFLKIYVGIIYQNKRDFAKDIQVTPVELSQVLNNHRKPKDSFLKKLIVHSERVYEHVCPFSGKVWLEVYHQDQMSKTMNEEAIWRPDIEKQVTLSEPFTPYKK